MRDIKISLSQRIVNKCNSLTDFTHELREHTDRFVVSTYPIYKGVNPSLDEGLITKISDAIASKQIDSIGLWTDDKGIYHVDGNLHFDDLEWALRVAKAFSQQAIYDKKNDEVLHLCQNSEALIVSLLNRYAKVKDELLDYTQEHHDAMDFDILGYWQTLHEEGVEDVGMSELKGVVEVYEALLKALKGVDLVSHRYC